MQTPFKKFRKILTAMLKITYAPCGYVNVLSFSLAHWARGWQGHFFVCFKNCYRFKNNSCSLTLSRVHIQDLLPLTGKMIFFCPQNVSNAISIYSVLLPVKGATSTAP